jgi:hypothetical protein
MLYAASVLSRRGHNNALGLKHVMEMQMKYHAITFGFLLLAIASYFVGAIVGVALFIVLGLISEAVFWVRLFRGSTRGGTSR